MPEDETGKELDAEEPDFMLKLIVKTKKKQPSHLNVEIIRHKDDSGECSDDGEPDPNKKV